VSVTAVTNILSIFCSPKFFFRMCEPTIEADVRSQRRGRMSRANKGRAMMARRFPPPWSVEEQDARSGRDRPVRRGLIPTEKGF
jgi:hypothetical protein